MNGQALIVVGVLLLASVAYWLIVWRDELRDGSPRGEPYRARHLANPAPNPARRARVVAAFSLGLLAAGCGWKPFPNAGAAGNPSAAPVPAISAVRVDGVSLHVQYVFSTAKDRQAGLQHRALLPSSAAVFSWGGPQVEEAFWMINTPEALSLLWVRQGVAVGHVEMARCAVSCRTYAAPGKYDTAVEAPEGSFARVHVGDEVYFS